MIKKEMRELIDSINQADDISAERKVELNKILNALMAEENAELKKSVPKFNGLIHEFEASHPDIAAIINRISMMLSSIGV